MTRLQIFSGSIDFAEHFPAPLDILGDGFIESVRWSSQEGGTRQWVLTTIKILTRTPAELANVVNEDGLLDMTRIRRRIESEAFFVSSCPSFFRGLCAQPGAGRYRLSDRDIHQRFQLGEANSQPLSELRSMHLPEWLPHAQSDLTLAHQWIIGAWLHDLEQRRQGASGSVPSMSTKQRGRDSL
ncbi:MULTISPECIES: hypothetical protein [unclassified Thioalkalivibrio]|uniref:hypothetical protein n=1 Tax=unclassified Thioalkalivibrio TaxID=2621013 RepID=UPI00036F3563|nr:MULTISPECIES: hypothetical protein [unclassified Thioalkalivibrio]